MTKSNSKAEDDRRAAASQGRVDKEHGGTVVESIAPGDLESFNDAECKHEKLIPDESETDFKAFKCANEKCSIIVLYDK